MALPIRQKSTLNWRHLLHRLRFARRVLASLEDYAWQSLSLCFWLQRLLGNHRRSPGREALFSPHSIAVACFPCYDANMILGILSPSISQLTILTPATSSHFRGRQGCTQRVATIHHQRPVHLSPPSITLDKQKPPPPCHETTLNHYPRHTFPQLQAPPLPWHLGF
ncbi:hypothetical protein B0H65DRAFT_247253 [Neurospora tetraspora]|uniref:Uncharacterized protein n=1 Tax=Neurospora tetraspora TaxID=94610 RepID=A0AAE0JAF1_9PEZI|nr:hypothetical protein B0H65DRAFT_247253 [Neurospora tetraspora]